MTSSSPSAQGAQRSFNSALLERTVIAIPLLEHIQEEVSMIEWALNNRPEWFGSFKCAVILNLTYPGGTEMAYAAAIELVRQAKKRFPDEDQDPDEGHDNVNPALEKVSKYSFVVTRLSNKVRRKIMALNRDLSNQPIKAIIPTLYDVIIDLNLGYYAGRDVARKWVHENVPLAIKAILKDTIDIEQKVRDRSKYSQQYVFARIEARALLELVKMDAANDHTIAPRSQEANEPTGRKTKKSKLSAAPGDVDEGQSEEDIDKYHAIHHIWPDFAIRSCITQSVATVKADAAYSSFGAAGKGLTWAVMDSGINADHPHFKLHGTIDTSSDLHCDFTDTESVPEGKNGALIDIFGHGTHVAGIIAGEQCAEGPGASPGTMRAVTRTIESFEDGHPGKVTTQTLKLSSIRGMAPQCKLVSLKVS